MSNARELSQIATAIVVDTDKNVSLPKNLTFTGTGNRITGDFSNATQTNRVTFQTSTTNSNTSIAAIPNGTATGTNFVAFSTADPTNSSFIRIRADGAGAVTLLESGTSGSGTYLPITMYTNGLERLRIDTSGNVGIGTSSPARKLDVRAAYTTDTIVAQIGNTNNGNGATPVATIFDFTEANGTSVSRIASIYTQSAGTTSLAFGTFSGGSLAERMRIDSSGNLLVGTTDAKAPLTVGKAPSSSAYGQIAALSAAAGDVGNAGISVTKYDNNTTTSQVFARFLVNQGSTASGQINANGASAAAFGAYSDARLKENIVNLPSQLANIMALRPVEFDYKAGGHQIGFIAQEVNEIYPDLVGEDEDGMLTLTDMNKNDARLIKAIQELKAIVDQQSTELDSVKAELQTLKGN